MYFGHKIPTGLGKMAPFCDLGVPPGGPGFGVPYPRVWYRGLGKNPQNAPGKYLGGGVSDTPIFTSNWWPKFNSKSARFL